MKTKNLFLIRHGETDWNRAKRFQGRTDIPLNDEGRGQALGLCPRMIELKIDLVVSSSLSRAYETALIAIQDVKLPIQKDDRLQETNIGEAEGLTHEEITEKFGTGHIERWRSYEERDLDFRYPNGESKRQMMVRVREAVLDIAQSNSHQNIAVFAHGMVMRALTFAFHQGVEWDLTQFHNGCIHHFAWDDKRPEHLKYIGKVN
ncbi:MAG: histidine phosphatase family protein [Bdellovibrionota bacterium]